MKIYIAGHRGLVGSSLARLIDKRELDTWYGYSRSELDLQERDAVLSAVLRDKPDALIIAAAKVGGIGANSKFPVQFMEENLRIQTNLMEAAHLAGVKRLLFLGSSCIYPKFAKQPITEEQLLTGALEESNAAYAVAKIAGLTLIDAYRKQYAKAWISLMPTNLYGPLDNFDVESAHVLPSLIRKFDLAKSMGSATVELWGTGSPKREFLHVDDLADACLFALANYDGDIPLNVGSGEEVTIQELANLTRTVVGFKGEVYWNSGMPDGTPRKLLDSSRLIELGWSPKISLGDGLRQTYNWYLENLAGS